MSEVINIPLSWLRSAKRYAHVTDDPPRTAREMRERGYIINETTWPAIRWERGNE